MTSIKSPENYYPELIGGEKEGRNKTEGGTLYLVATPIGNLSDISARALKVLSEVDFIAAEDTRNSGRLLAFYGVKKPFVSYFEHNKRERGTYIAERLKSGESCALITDAGMPAISDPGEDLVALCAAEGIPVRIIPGACAAVSALALSGLPTSRFAFEGFLSTAKAERRERLESLREEPRTLIFYEAPHKLLGTLADLYVYLGERKAALCRELTKLNEEVVRTTLSLAPSLFDTNPPRGEFVIIVEGCSAPSHFWDGMSIEEHFKHYSDSGLERSDALKAVARDRKVAKSVIYAELLK